MVAATPTRSAVLEMKDERRAMHEGYVFLDEKCLLLAGEILRALASYRRLSDQLARRHEAAIRALRAAVGRHLSARAVFFLNGQGQNMEEGLASRLADWRRPQRHACEVA